MASIYHEAPARFPTPGSAATAGRGIIRTRTRGSGRSTSTDTVNAQWGIAAFDSIQTPTQQGSKDGDHFDPSTHFHTYVPYVHVRTAQRALIPCRTDVATGIRFPMIGVPQGFILESALPGSTTSQLGLCDAFARCVGVGAASPSRTSPTRAPTRPTSAPRAGASMTTRPPGREMRPRPGSFRCPG